MLVAKFGGTSVGSPKAIRQIFSIITDERHKGKTRVVVVSAFSGVTDALITAGKDAASGKGAYKAAIEALKKRHDDAALDLLGKNEEASAYIASVFTELMKILDGVAAIGELSLHTLDMIMSAGERLSAKIIAVFFTKEGCPAEYLDSRLVVKTSGRHGNAAYLPTESEAAITAYIKEHPLLQIAAGFIGQSIEGKTTTLGRGGSDLSASIYGASLVSIMPIEAVEIWTDVDGILSADPRIVKNAFRLAELSYIEALEISHFGAKVLYPPTVRPALQKNIPIWLGNSFNPASPGTWVRQNVEAGDRPIRGLSSLDNVSILRLQGAGMAGSAGFASRLFGALARKSISVILITQASSEYSICAALDPTDVYAAAAAVMEEFDREIAQGGIEKPDVENGCSIIAAVGQKMKSSPGISSAFFGALSAKDINIKAIAQGSSETNISVVISRSDKEKALLAVHDAFFEPHKKHINLFLLGTGLIGGELLRQIASQKAALEAEGVVLTLLGVANSKKMLFGGNGIDISSAKDALQSAKDDFSLEKFIDYAKNTAHSTIADCTANDNIALSHATMLAADISVVTPNKRGVSSSLAYFKQLTGSKNALYLFEATVGAGLPVISTIRDLLAAGDKITSIEGVLSGTLSFIFNTFDGRSPFSAVVKEAKAKGYTEPDPRDDLCAKDAARKALILARLAGYPLSMDDIAIEPLLGSVAMASPSVDDFFAALTKEEDARFAGLVSNAAGQKKKLRYIASIKEGRASLALRAEGEDSPFYSLSGADNIVVIKTERYNAEPLVVKGPGAGAGVTAGIVFADILRTGK